MMKFLAALRNYVVARLRERSTVAGLVALVAGAIGVAISPDQATMITSVVVMIAGGGAATVPGGK